LRERAKRLVIKKEFGWSAPARAAACSMRAAHDHL
jgi:hypothetical protein